MIYRCKSSPEEKSRMIVWTRNLVLMICMLIVANQVSGQDWRVFLSRADSLASAGLADSADLVLDLAVSKHQRHLGSRLYRSTGIGEQDKVDPSHARLAGRLLQAPDLGRARHVHPGAGGLINQVRLDTPIGEGAGFVRVDDAIAKIEHVPGSR